MNKQKQLEALKLEMNKCTACKLQGVKVFDNGNPDADLMIIAEAPGADEEIQGVPLIGRCGKLIEDMLNHIGLSRKDTWRANCLVCRPPKNRDPEEKEIEACSHFLLKQIEIIQPKVIVVLGKFAAQTMLNTETPISKLRGRWFNAEESDLSLFVTFHPSYILRNGKAMIDNYKSDFEKIREKLNGH